MVFGAVIGKLMVDSGAANQIAETLTGRLGARNAKMAMVLTGLVFGLAMFYEVAFIIMAPLIVAVAQGNLDYPTPAIMRPDAEVAVEDRPSFALSVLVPLVPAIVMIGATIANIWLTKGTTAHAVVNFIGSPIAAISLALVAAFWAFGIRQGRDNEWLMRLFDQAVKAIAGVVLIIGAGGALKQIIIDTGIGDYIGSLMTGTSANP